jgi:hypothetical protein
VDFKFDPQNWDGLLRLVLLILPGIVFFETFKRFVERPFPGKEVYIAKVLYASMLFFLANSVLLYLWSRTPDGYRFAIPDPIQLPLQAIAIPFVAAIVLAALDQRRWFVRLAAWMGVAAVDPSPGGWDLFFGKRESAFVIIGLKDGSKVFGYFGSNSMASTDATSRDIYLERVYRLPDNPSDPWIEVPGSKGILILQSEMQYMEFRGDQV